MLDAARGAPLSAMSLPVLPFRRWFERLLAFQVGRPWAVLALALLLTLPAAVAAAGLGLRTDFSELLPDNKPSVVEMRRVSQHLTSASTLTIFAEVDHPNAPALRAFADALAPRIRALGPDWVGTVDEGTQERRKFFDRNKLLYAPLADIEKVHDEVRERWDWEVGQRTGGDLGLDDEPPPPLTAESVKKRFSEQTKKLEDDTGGYYLGEGNKVVVVLVRTPVEPGSEAAAKRLRTRIDQIVAEIDATRLDPTMKVRYTGDFITSLEEVRAIKDDLGQVGAWGIGMVLLAVFVFFLRARTIVLMGLTIAVGLVWTFGVARFTVGYLNSSTGFLVSIIAGNGINFGIIYMARFLEARRLEGASPEQAARTAHEGTWVGTFAAALAAMVAYGSLAITDFRGFKHFGIIGGAGMLLCWLSTYLFLPTMLVAWERWRPTTAGAGWLERARALYGRGFAWLALRAPRAITVFGLALGLAGTAYTVRYFHDDPIEYDMRKLRTERTKPTDAGELSERTDKVVGSVGQEGMAIMVDRLDQVLPVKAELERVKAAAAADQKPFEQVVTIFDLLPSDQKAKLPLLADTRAVLHKARGRGFITDADWRDLEGYLPAADLQQIGPGDLPEQMARAFVEKDGTRGRIVYIVPKSGRSIWDAHYLKLWASSFRSIHLPGGEVIKGSGRAVIYADMIDAVVEDAPKAIAASLLGTILIVLLAFRGRRAAFTVLATLLLGVAWMIGFLATHRPLDELMAGARALHLSPADPIKLNFLNFVALPITFGIGADYAVNVMQRYEREGHARLRAIVVETGGAVVLCSLTTTLGYLSLTLSVNQAVVSFGTAAAAGEIACIVAAVLVLPAALAWWHRKRPSDDARAA